MVLEKLYFPISYKENKACDKKVYYASVCARMEQIYKHIRYSITKTFPHLEKRPVDKSDRPL